MVRGSRSWGLPSRTEDLTYGKGEFHSSDKTVLKTHIWLLVEESFTRYGGGGDGDGGDGDGSVGVMEWRRLAS